MNMDVPECNICYLPAFMSLFEKAFNEKRMRCSYKDLLFEVRASREINAYDHRRVGYEMYLGVSSDSALDEIKQRIFYEDKPKHRIQLIPVVSVSFKKTDPDVFVFDDDHEFLDKLPLVYTVFFCSQLLSAEYSADMVVKVAKKILQSIKDGEPEYQYFCKRWLPQQDAAVGLNLYAFTQFIETYMRGTRVAMEYFGCKFEAFLSDMKIVLVGVPQPLPEWAKAFEVLDEECQPENSFVASETKLPDEAVKRLEEGKDESFTLVTFIKCIYTAALMEKIFEHHRGKIDVWEDGLVELLGPDYVKNQKTEQRKSKKAKLVNDM